MYKYTNAILPHSDYYVSYYTSKLMDTATPVSKQSFLLSTLIKSFTD